MNHNENGTVAVGAPNSAMRRITEQPEPKWPCTVGAENWPPTNYDVRTNTPWGTAQTATWYEIKSPVGLPGHGDWIDYEVEASENVNR